MKNRTWTKILLPLLTLSCLSGCGATVTPIADDKYISSLELSGSLAKTNWSIDEEWGHDGLILTALYTNGAKKSLSTDTTVVWSFSPSKPSTLGQSNLTVSASYKTFTSNELTFAVNCYDPDPNPVVTLTLTGAMEKTSYSAGEAWDPKGLYVTATRKDGSEWDVSGDSALTWNFFPLAPKKGTTEVKVSATYRARTTDELAFPVSVASSGEIPLPSPEQLPLGPYYLVNNGVSEYTIVYPENAGSYMSFAVSELITHFKDATGATLSSVRSDQLSSHEEDGYYISLGDTPLLEKKIASGEISVPTNLGYSGYYLKTIGKTIYVISSSLHFDEGVMNGVYQLLSDAFHYEAYSSDEIYIDNVLTKKGFIYDNAYLPSFDQRELGYQAVSEDATYLKRLRLISRFNSSFKEWVPNFYSHTQSSLLLTTKKYKAAHPDWFVPSGRPAGDDQIHWGWGMGVGENGEPTFTTDADALRDAMAYEVEEVLKKYPEQTLMCLGEEDHGGFCTCDQCKKLNTQYTGSATNHSGVQIIFINRVIEKVEEWLSANYPSRAGKMHYYIFAYHDQTIDAPVKRDDTGNIIGLYSPYDKPHDQLYQQYAPIHAKFDHDFYDSQNEVYRSYLEGWNYVFPNRIALWTYENNYSNYLVNFNNFHVIQPQIRFFKENGVSHYFGQGAHNSHVPCLENMRLYAESKLLFDCYGDNYEDLVQNYMDHYYDGASTKMHEYYSLIRDNYVRAQNEYDNYGSINASIATEEVYSEPFVAKLWDVLDEALQAIAPLQLSDSNRYATLLNRIKKERVSIDYLTIKLYSSFYTDEEIAAMRSEFYQCAAKNGITRVSEFVEIDDNTL